MDKQADCKSVALGRCRFESCSADYMPQYLNWRRSCLESNWSGNPGLRVRVPPVVLYGDVCQQAGGLSRKQVIQLGLRVRIPPSPLISRSGRIGKCTCLLSRGRVIRHPGSRPGSGARRGGQRPQPEVMSSELTGGELTGWRSMSSGCRCQTCQRCRCPLI